MTTLTFHPSSLHPKTLTPKSPSNPHFQTLTLTPKTPNFTHLTTKLTTTTTAAAAATTTTQTLKSRLKNNETLYGLFLLSFSPTLAEIAALSGYDFVVIDMEHGHGGISHALPCLHALAAARTPAIIRLPETDAAWAKKALDLGPEGIMFPMIESEKMAKKAVSFCRFPPAGVRGSAHTVVRASDYGIDNGYINCVDDELLIMCQVESAEGVKKIEEIAAVDGVDCVQMGPLDLSASMGYLWDPGNKKVKAVLQKAESGVLKARKEGGAFLGGFAMPHDRPEELRDRGYHMVSGAVDIGLFRSACVADVKRFKALRYDEEVDEDDVGDGEEKYWSE